MSATNAFETSILGLIFTNAAAANVGDASGLQPSATAGVFHVSLHTGDPGETGDQTTSEADYTDYARESVARSTSGWTVTGNVVDNDAEIAFTVAGATTADTITHFGLGSAGSGAGNLFIYGVVSPNLVVNEGITPTFAAGALDVSLD